MYLFIEIHIMETDFEELGVELDTLRDFLEIMLVFEAHMDKA